MVTLDLSFISVLKVMPALAAVMAPGAQMVVLIKPQFEAGRAQVGSGGLVKDPQVIVCLCFVFVRVCYRAATFVSLMVLHEEDSHRCACHCSCVSAPKHATLR